MFSKMTTWQVASALALAIHLGLVTGAADAQTGTAMPIDQRPINGAQPIPASPLDVLKAPDAQTPVTKPEFLDLTSGKFDKLDIALDNAQFSNASIDKLHITASDMDFKGGHLKALAIDASGGHFADVVFDQLSLSTQADMTFDPAVLMNDKVLQFSTPTEATITAVVNQDTLNAFLNNPKTLERLSVSAGKRVGLLASMLGANASSFGITLSDASVALLKDNRISIATKANVGMGGIGVPLPLELLAKLDLADGWISVSDTHLNTNGQEISPQLSEMLVKKINGLAGWGSKSQDIQFSFTDLKVVPGKQFALKGTCKISRLRFGKEAKEATP